MTINMDNNLIIKMHVLTLDCKDTKKLAEFYAALLKWEIAYDNEEYMMIAAPEKIFQGMYPRIAFQKNSDYIPPVWPEEPNAQQQMAHIDFVVNDMEKAVQHAIRCGASIADDQFPDSYIVMFDPAGHPFCLCLMKSVIEDTRFALY
jgi:predicted enzyme related to lactoylglutathione lyase